MLADNILALSRAENPVYSMEKRPLPEFPGFYEFTYNGESAEHMQYQFLNLLVVVAKFYIMGNATPYFCFPMNGANEMYALFIDMVNKSMPAEHAAIIRGNIRFIAKSKTGATAENGKPECVYQFSGEIPEGEDVIVAFVDENVDSCDTVVDSMRDLEGRVPIQVFALTSKTDTFEIMRERGVSATVLRTFPHNEQGKDSWITAGGWLDWGVYPEGWGIFDIARVKVKERLCANYIGFYPSEGSPKIDMVAYEAYLDANMRKDVSAADFDRLVQMEIAYMANDPQLQFMLMQAWDQELHNAEAEA